MHFVSKPHTVQQQHTEESHDDSLVAPVFVPFESTYYSHARRGLSSPPGYHPSTFYANDFHTLADDRPYLRPATDRFSFGYLVSVSIGSPAQHVTLMLTTRSEKTWVHSDINHDCRKTSTDFCRPTGTYNRGSSSSSRSANTRSKVGLSDSSYVRVIVVADSISVGNVSLDNFVFGMAEEGDCPYGRFGLLKPTGVASARASAFVNTLLDRGRVKISSFSMYVDNHNLSTGGLLFGAIDKSKFMGPLKTTGALRTPQALDRFQVVIGGIKVYNPLRPIYAPGSPSTALATRLAVRLEPETAWSNLPYRVGARIAEAVTGGPLNYRYEARSAMFYVPCEANYEDTIVEVEFWDDVKIPVMASQLVSQVGIYDDGRPMCAMAYTAPRPIRGRQLEGENQEFTLGDSFLRSAYLFYDQTNVRVSVARLASSNTTSSAPDDAQIQIIDEHGLDSNSDITGLPETPYLPPKRSSPSPVETPLAVAAAATAVGRLQRMPSADLFYPDEGRNRAVVFIACGLIAMGIALMYVARYPRIRRYLK
ncbi:aspartic peptidase domain-containing protein [Myxozyma melibiosi]|uniref:Aspartic peptidase domain-containing protein n=1 Tax=Myxozyma melibiosi TaxID=54550 RepID=A0ABR1FBW5_9ASCO